MLDSGLKQTVFVDRGNGFFEPRKVETGWLLGDRVEILKGLSPGDRIVVSANFLFDSESRMRLAAAGLFGEVTRDPVCFMNLDLTKAKAGDHKIDYQGQTYYFCSEECQKKFHQAPERYVDKVEPEPAQTSQDHGHGKPQTQTAPAPSAAMPPAPPATLPGPIGPTPPAGTPVTPPAATPAMPPPGAQATPPAGTPVTPPGSTLVVPPGPTPIMPPGPVPVQPPSKPQTPPTASPTCPPGHEGLRQD